MRDQVTFCIKTIHRPQCCAALVRSIHEHYGTNRPAIHVLDDGKPELRFSTNCPTEAAMVDQLIETDFDIGLSAGRNRLLDTGETPIVVFTDDDHLVSLRGQWRNAAAHLKRQRPMHTHRLFAFIPVFSALSCRDWFATFALVRSGYLTGKQLSASPPRTQQRNLSDSLS